MADAFFMYRTTGSIGIERCEVLRETARFVVLRDPFHGKKEIRESKNSDWANWHKTWESAHEFLLSRAIGRLRAQETQARMMREKIAELARMTNPGDSNG